jgi:hypothetical protein
MRAHLLTSTAAMALLGAMPAHAQNATWLLNPGTSNFNTAANWTPTTVPTGTAFFGQSNTTALSFSPMTDTEIGGWTFDAGASNYTFNIPNTFVQFSGAGIIINGGSATIVNNGSLNFDRSSTAGNASITNHGVLDFFGFNTTAGNASITNTNSGTLQFAESTTAGNASINNNGVLAFSNSGTAGNATITTNSGGSTSFGGTSTGGNARFITNVGGVFNVTSAGMTAGSIEGAGNYFLGSNLTVGGNNLSTTVSGVIAGNGGSLTKPAR